MVFFPRSCLAISLMFLLTGCADREEDWLHSWPAHAAPASALPVKGLSGEKHHF